MVGVGFKELLGEQFDSHVIVRVQGDRDPGLQRFGGPDRAGPAISEPFIFAPRGLDVPRFRQALGMLEHNRRGQRRFRLLRIDPLQFASSRFPLLLGHPTLGLPVAGAWQQRTRRLQLFHALQGFARLAVFSAFPLQHGQLYQRIVGQRPLVLDRQESKEPLGGLRVSQLPIASPQSKTAFVGQRALGVLPQRLGVHLLGGLRFAIP